MKEIEIIILINLYYAWNMLRVILVASLWKLKICIHNEVWTKSRVIIIKNIFT